MKKEIVLNKRKFSYFEKGQGPTFLLIHGWGPGAAQGLFEFQDLLAGQGYRVILLDLPGFGLKKKDLLSFVWEMDDYLKYVSDFIKGMNLKEFYLWGHSFGGAVSVRLADSFHKRIRALFLISPGIFRSESAEMNLFHYGYKAFLIGQKIRMFFLLPTLVNLKKLPFFRKSTKLEEKIKDLKIQYVFFFEKDEIMSRTLDHIARTENTKHYLSKIKCPTLVVWGQKDFILYNLNASLTGHIPDHDFEVIFEAGHALPEEATETLIELIVKFIDKINKKTP